MHFSPYSSLFQPLRLRRLIDKIGSSTHPSPRPWPRLCLVKIRDTRTEHLPPDQRQQPGQGHPDGHTAIGARDHPLSTTMYDNPCTHGLPPCGYKRRSPGSPGEGNTTLHRWPPRSILALASITHMNLGSTPSLD
jgi:hypothetical protein